MKDKYPLVRKVLPYRFKTIRDEKGLLEKKEALELREDSIDAYKKRLEEELDKSKD